MQLEVNTGFIYPKKSAMKTQHAEIMFTLWTCMILTLITCTGVDSARSLPKSSCPCQADKKLCDRANTDFNGTESVVVSSAVTDYTKWKWDSITTVVMEDQKKLFTAMMCYTRSQGAKYGFIEPFPKNLNSSDLTGWTSALLYVANQHFVQVIVLDLISFVSPCHYTSDPNKTQDLVKDVRNVTSEIQGQGIKVMCLLPWKPPCYGNDCHFVSEISDSCDAFITSPESYTTSCDMSCRARATVPFSKLVVGTDEYLTQVPREKLMMGIPWHGYDYTCSKFDTSTEMCKLPWKNGTSTGTCDYESSRYKLTTGGLLEEYDDRLYSNSTLMDIAYKSPHFNTYDNSTGKHHQFWYENLDSLHIKYRFAKDLEVRGVVIWTADDLDTHAVLLHPKYKLEMWSWLVHDLLRQGDISFHPSYNMSLPGSMAGVGVACFVIGSLLGLAVGFMMFRGKGLVKRPAPPFSQDEREVDEYHDDDNTL